MKIPKPGKIRNRFLQKNLISLAVVVVLAIGTGTAYGTLSSRDADRGEDPVSGINQDRYQVLLSGEGFKLSKQQEKDYKLQKKQNKVNAAKDAQEPNTMRYSNGPRTFRAGSSYRYRYSGHTYKVSKNPRVSSNISDQINMESTWKSGDTLKFRVSAYAYPYGTKNAISSKNITIKVEVGKAAKLYRSKNGYHYYSVVLGEGKNKITISATDTKEKKTTKIGPYTIKAGKGSTDPTHEEPVEETKTVEVSANYGTEGVIDLNGDVSEDKTLAQALQEMGVQIIDSEIVFVPGEFDLAELDEELRAKYRTDHDMSEDEAINETLYSSWLETEVISKTEEGIGQDHPFSTTHWICDKDLNTKVKNLNSGITLTLILYEE